MKKRVNNCFALANFRYGFATGFTLVELVTTILIVAILAVFAIPRFVGTGGYEPRTAQDTILAAARRAQQLAMNKGNAANVQLTTDNTNKRARITYLEGGAQTLDFEIPPAITITDSSTAYDVLGNASSAVTINIDSNRNVCIEATGYAYLC